jgi:uncharacterized protein YgiM (DUF1202 family)
LGNHKVQQHSKIPQRGPGRPLKEEDLVSTSLTKPLRRAGAIIATTAVAGAAVAIGTTQLATAGSATATTGVNIRSGPGTKYDIVGGLVRGQRITAVSKPRNGWVKVRFNGDAAYISADYLNVGGNRVSASPVTIHTKGIKITTAPLNVRAGAGLDQAVIGYLSDGQKVALTGKQSRGFAEILYGGRRAWVSAQYLISSFDDLPSSTRTRVATADLLIRTSTGADFKIITTVRKGTKLQVTGATKNGYAQIVYRDAIRWVTAKYLSGPGAAGPVAPKPDQPKPDKPKPDKPSKPKPDKPAPLPSVVATRYATTELLVRTTSGRDYQTVATVQRGDKVKITGSYRNGKAQIIYRSKVRWVTAEYLSKRKPGVSKPSGDGDSGSSGGGTDPSYGGGSRDVPNSTWDELARCESSGNWSINTGNGYYGGLQFSLQTWRGFGGTGMPHQASRLEQIKIAERVLAVQGWGAWPACSRKLGLR